MSTRTSHTLAAYATPNPSKGGRRVAEPTHDYRSEYQRDRDRIIHSRAFRRLEYKTQVFVNHEGDYYRTRLTHTLEVTQIARTIARALTLNEDLTEAICLAHDLGHTPFGHAGETAMNTLMQGHGGFEHNRQSFRVVTFLEERYAAFHGLNLTYDVLEGLTKHTGTYTFPEGDVLIARGAPTLEAQLCDFADEIAYNNHDIDDGLKSGILSLGTLRDIELWQTHFEPISKQLANEPERIQILQTVRAILNTLVTDLIDTTFKRIEASDIRTEDDVRTRGLRLVGFSDAVKRQNTDLKRALFKHLYRHYRVERMAVKAQRILKELFHEYLENPTILPPQFFDRIERDGLHTVICDYIAGMTDRYALLEHKKLFDPFERV